ncbi:B9 domain-containing protein 1 isoform X2 [Anticarsia gemmatalis]|uniref:B9 domain-containing protein 1 isoform X2 n=1 Tax=Anticarsia gemmatalis TaxID=129554 RepID=UPI003F758BCA
MKDSEITKFLVCFSGQIEYVTFPGGVFDDQLYVHYEAVWGPDWNPMSGLTSGTSQMARSGVDPERVVFNLPIEMVFSSTNVSGWPQLLITVRAQNTLTGNALRGYSLFLMPPTTGHVMPSFAPLIRPRAATVLVLRTESYGSVTVSLNMVSKDLRKLGYDNQPPAIKFVADT